MAGLLAWVMLIPSAKRSDIVHQFMADRALDMSAAGITKVDMEAV